MKNKKNARALTEETVLRLIKKAMQYESYALHRGSPGPGLIWLEESIRSGAFENDFNDEIDNSANYHDVDSYCEMCGCPISTLDGQVCHACDSTVSESKSYYFDKHIDKILISEHKHKSVDEKTPTPQRIRAKRNQEKPGNRIIFGSKK